jgi:hypothetical protein
MTQYHIDDHFCPVFTTCPPPFWLVWSEMGGSPTVKHRTEQEAFTEACRLAQKHRGRKFHVLRSESYAEDVVVKTALVKTKYQEPTP